MRNQLAPGVELSGGWKLVRRLGRGTMGEVWVAESPEHEPVAVKFLIMRGDPTARQRFEREWLMASSIESPHAVRMFERGTTADGRPFMVMELVQGDTLEEELERRGVIPPGEVVRLLGQAAHALDAAHARGIIHRDVKPENILLCKRGSETVVKVLDFGLAKPFEGGQTLTATGLLIGTPYYMSPEQLRDGGKDLDHRADLWALAAVTYRMLLGCQPFDAESLHELVHEIFRGRFRPLDEIDGLVMLAPWFKRAFDLDRDKRFASAGEMVDELSRLLAPPGTVGVTLVLDAPDSVTLTAPRPSQIEPTQAELTVPLGSTAVLDWPRNRELDTITEPFASIVIESTSDLPPSSSTSDFPPRAQESFVAIPSPSQPTSLPTSSVADAPTRRRPPRRSPVAALLAVTAIVLAAGIGAWAAWHFVDDPRIATVAPFPSPPLSSGPPEKTPLVPLPMPSVAASARPATSSSIIDPRAKGRAWLTVECEPFCIVLLNGRRIGNSPIKKRMLVPGKHKITGYRDDIGARKVAVELEPGEHEKVYIDMRR